VRGHGGLGVLGDEVGVDGRGGADPGGGGLQAFKLLIPASSPSGPPELRVHEGYDWLYVLSGRVRLLLGEHDLILMAGEAAEFDTHTPHWFGNPGSEPAEVLCLFGPQGERMHLRARAAR